MLEVSGLEAGYGDGRVLFGVDLAIAAGEVVTSPELAAATELKHRHLGV